MKIVRALVRVCISIALMVVLVSGVAWVLFQLGPDFLPIGLVVILMGSAIVLE